MESGGQFEYTQDNGPRTRFRTYPKGGRYHSRNRGSVPYSRFGKAEFVDTDGREYKVAKGDIVEEYTRIGKISEPFYGKPPLYEESDLGDQLMWVRIPIATRGSVEVPGFGQFAEQITLYHVETQVLCKGEIVESLFDRRRKTGLVRISGMRSFGQPSDPKGFNSIAKIGSSN